MTPLLSQYIIPFLQLYHLLTSFFCFDLRLVAVAVVAGGTVQVRPQSTWFNGTTTVLAVGQLTIASTGQLLGSAVFQGHQGVSTTPTSQPSVFGQSSLYGLVGGGSGGGNAGPGTAGAMNLAGGSASTISSVAVSPSNSGEKRATILRFNCPTQLSLASYRTLAPAMYI